MRSVRIMLCALAVTAVAAFSLTSYAATPIQISHQGILRDASSVPVSGTRSLTFHIYESELGGSPVWSEIHPLVSIEQGLFNVTLGSVNALTNDVLSPGGSGLSADPIQRFLEVQVDADAPLLPRTRLIAAPYAVATSRVSGDIETHPGEIEIKDLGKLLKDGVDNAKVHRLMSNTEGGQLNELTAVARKNKTFQKMTDSDIASRTVEISADSGGSRVTLESDDDGDGQSERGVVASDGAYVRARRVMVAGWETGIDNDSHFDLEADSAGSSLNVTYADPDVTGGTALRTTRSGAVSTADYEYKEKSRRYASTADSIGASSLLEVDEDSDGIPDSRILQACRPSSASLAIKTKGTSAQRIGITAVAKSDSSVLESSFDENGDGVAERRFLGAITTQSASNRLSSDTDGDGFLESSVEQLSDDTSGSIMVVSRFGAGPRQTTSMDGSFVHSRTTCASDLDADGLADNETENFADPTSARMRIVVQKHTLEPHEARMSADATGPRIEISTASTVRASMSLDGVQVSDNSGAVVSEIRSDGNAYIAGNMKFGAVAGAHRIDVEGGAYCDGTNWVNASDANSKENFAMVDGREILNKLADLDITRWNYKGQADAHIGPTAQDFRETFGVGSDDKSISTIDPSGIALAAIKELNRQNQELRERNNALKSELDDLKRKVDHLINSR